MCEYAGEKEEMYLEKKGYARSDEEKWMREMRIKMTSSRVEQTCCYEARKNAANQPRVGFA